MLICVYVYLYRSGATRHSRHSEHLQTDEKVEIIYSYI